MSIELNYPVSLNPSLLAQYLDWPVKQGTPKSGHIEKSLSGQKYWGWTGGSVWSQWHLWISGSSPAELSLPLKP